MPIQCLRLSKRPRADPSQRVVREQSLKFSVSIVPQNVIEPYQEIPALANLLIDRKMVSGRG